MSLVPRTHLTFGDLSHSRQNHFDLLRLVLSLAVLYSHSYALSGQTQDAITRLTGNQTAASTFALFGFFVISGYLIAGSWERSRSWTDFIARRARRILPGFIVAVLFCFLIVGPLSASSLHAYFRDPSAWRFVSLLCMRVPQAVLSSFMSNPDPGMLNGSLWTIRLEISCYVLTALAGAAGLLRKPVGTVLIAVVAASIWIAFQSPALNRLRFSFYIWGMVQMTVPFAIGMAAYGCRNWISASRWFFVLSIAALVTTAIIGGMTYAIWICGAYSLIFFGLLPGEPVLTKWIGDLSYGVYLYAFPVQQLIVQWMHNPGPATLMAIAVPITLTLAWVSWTFVESPMLHRPTARRHFSSKSEFETTGLLTSVE